jgi:hypothetical protein
LEEFHEWIEAFFRRECSARAAEHYLYRLAADSLRRETLDDEACGAERAAFRN